MAQGPESAAVRSEDHRLDQLVAKIHRAGPTLARASHLSLVSVTGLLTAVDLTIWATDPEVKTGRLSFSLAVLVPCLGVLATAAVAVRRRGSIVALATLGGAGTSLTVAVWIIGSGLPPSFAALFALALLAMRVLRHQPAMTAVALIALSMFAVAAESLRPMVSTAAYLLVLCEGSFGTAVGIGVYLRWSDWRRTGAEAAARADERLAIARELHDLVGHHVTGIVVQAQAARHVAHRQPTAAIDALARIEAAGTDALVAMRRMVGGLRDDRRIEPGLTWDSIDQLLAEAKTQGVPVHATIEGGLSTTAGMLAPSVHRIITESLTNVRRHARGVSSIHIALFTDEGHLVLTVHDDGAPTVAPGPGTFGIIGMQERAVALGGTLLAGPDPDGGWVVRAALPIGHAAGNAR